MNKGEDRRVRVVTQFDFESRFALMHDLEGCLRNRIQLTTDGQHLYLDSVGSAIDYIMSVKL